MANLPMAPGLQGGAPIPGAPMSPTPTWAPQINQSTFDLEEFRAWLKSNGHADTEDIITAFTTGQSVGNWGTTTAQDVYRAFQIEKTNGYQRSAPPTVAPVAQTPTAPSAPSQGAPLPNDGSGRPQPNYVPNQPGQPVATTPMTPDASAPTGTGTVVYRFSDGSFIVKLPDGSYVVKDALGGPDVPADPTYVNNLISGDTSTPKKPPVRYDEKKTPEGNTIITWYDADGGIVDTTVIQGSKPPGAPGPMPTEPPNPGYQWEWNENNNAWVQEPSGKSVTPPAKSMPTEPAPQGYHWELNTNTGEWYPAIGAPDTGQMSDYQTKSLELERERMKNDWMNSARNAAIQWMATLAQLKAHPGDWIQAYMFEHGFSADSKQLLDILTPPAWLTTPAQSPALPNPEVKGGLPEKYKQPGGGGNSWLPNLQGGPATPPTPEWLPTYVPGLKAGQPLTQQRSALPSGQLWGKTPYTKREMLGGYLEYSGKGYPTLTDLTEAIAANLPNRTATSQWRPATQR